MPDLRYVHVSADELPEHRQLLLDIYKECYADRLGEPFFSLDRFDERLTSHAAGNAWEAVIGLADAGPVGYAYGAALGTGTGWWTHQLEPLGEDFISETGSRTLALFEIMVLPNVRRNGFATAIHEELLGGRREERVTLLVDPRKKSTKAMYEQWGYKDVGPQKPFADSPIYSTMVRELASDA